MIKTIWKRKVPVEMQAHDECSSGHRVPLQLTRKMSFSIYGCGKASPGAAHAARFLHLHSPTAFPAAQPWKTGAEICWFGFSSDCCPMQTKTCTHPRPPTLLPPAAATNAFPRKSPVSTGNCPLADFSTEGINPNK